MHARHSAVVAAWRQVMVEAGGNIPDRNVERLLRNTHVPVDSNDLRRLDLVVPGLNVERGVPLFCDITVISPISRNGAPRGGTSNRGGSLLEEAENANNNTYREVLQTGLGSLQCLGFEVYGRWGKQCVKLLPTLARERTRGLHVRVRRGVALQLQRRWSGIVAVALQRAVAHMILHAADEGVDLFAAELEPAACLADLDVL